jgi:hypothetical protein
MAAKAIAQMMRGTAQPLQGRIATICKFAVKFAAALPCGPNGDRDISRSGNNGKHHAAEYRKASLRECGGRPKPTADLPPRADMVECRTLALFSQPAKELVVVLHRVLLP